MDQISPQMNTEYLLIFSLQSADGIDQFKRIDAFVFSKKESSAVSDTYLLGRLSRIERQETVIPTLLNLIIHLNSRIPLNSQASMANITSPLRDSTAAWCGHILRMDASPSNFYEFNPRATGPHEIDHFFELQHIVYLLFTPEGTLTVDNFHDVKLGYWIDLATAVNQRENMYKVSRTDNQLKKRITWAEYAPGQQNALIRTYLARVTGGYHHDHTKIGRTVEQQVRELAVAMARRKGPWSFLTRQVGQQICAHMGWRDGALSPKEHREIGDYNRQEWMRGDGKRLTSP
ncbi:hypothetical protein Daesc_010124 [Daldinia eschscholtzii]|uniref:Uncharacterized protein n=1 Tax=Daldinia eschscholtzii TaxID=292717 RepID=A0AAX6M6T9_9PEZI